MGTDPAPFIANLYLYNYEFKWLDKVTRCEYGKARLFNKTRRFIDDLITLNNDSVLGQRYKEIYPEALVLNKENADDKSATCSLFSHLYCQQENQH